MPVRQLEVDGNRIVVEVAHTYATRESGLMHRRSLAEDHGMLFVFTEPERHSMWMMNTSIPLSVAFLDEDGIILNISDMMPNTVTPHRSAGAAKYALEVNLGWFKKRKVAAVGFGGRPPRLAEEGDEPLPSRRVDIILFTPQI